MAHFLVSTSGSKSDQRVAHFQVDVYTHVIIKSKYKGDYLKDTFGGLFYMKVRNTSRSNTISIMALERDVFSN